MASWLTDAVAAKPKAVNAATRSDGTPAAQIIQRLSIESLTGATAGSKVLCPACDKPGEDPCLHVYGGDEGWYCYSCTKGGTVIDYVMLRDGIKHDEAIRKLADSLGIDLVPPVTLVPMPAEASTDVERGDAPASPDDKPATTWAPRSLDDVLSGDIDPVVPDVLSRTDGHGLFYRGRYNLLFGASESAKTWMALMAEVQVLTAGGRVVHIDLESEATEYVQRMRLLGATDSQLRDQLAYIYPNEALGLLTTGVRGQQEADLAAAFNPPADLVVLDALGEMLDLHGLNPSKNEDVPRMTRFLRRLAEGTRAAVVVIDHIPKVDGGANGPIGAQAKRSAVTGASYSCTASTKPAPGRTGKIVLRVDKDRPGQVRANCPGGATPPAARITMDAETSPGRILWHVEPPRGEGEASDALLARMNDVARVLADIGGLSKSKVREAVVGKAALTDDALERLKSDGYVDVRSGPRGALVHVLVKPYGSHGGASDEAL